MKSLLADNYSINVLTRTGKTRFGPEVGCAIWNALGGGFPAEALTDADAIVHLAGEPIAQRWTPEAKRRIRSSRVEGTQQLVQALASLERRPAVLICASAVGFYGLRGDEVLAESSPPGEGFLPELCVEWEKAAGLAEALGVRVVSIRTGVALGTEGGALAKMLGPFRWGLGGRLGSGRQWMSWIHVADLVRLIRFALAHDELHGPVNAVSPHPVTNAEFTEALGAVLRRPVIFPVPAAALQVLFGEMAEVLLGSQRVLPKAAESAGFGFEYPRLDAALKQLLA